MWRTIFGRGGGRGSTHPRGERGAAGLAAVTPAEARRLQRAGSLLVDVREPAEWDAGARPARCSSPWGNWPRTR